MPTTASKCTRTRRNERQPGRMNIDASVRNYRTSPAPANPRAPCYPRPMSLQPYLKRLMEERATLSREEARCPHADVHPLRRPPPKSNSPPCSEPLASRGEHPAEDSPASSTPCAPSATTLPPHERRALSPSSTPAAPAATSAAPSTSPPPPRLVAAAAGATVAKHGNRAVTSQMRLRRTSSKPSASP